MNPHDDYRSRMLEIVEQLHAQGVGRYTSAPPAYRLAWRLGVRVRPPIYQSFSTAALQMGVGFAVGWGVLMWVLFWRAEQYSLLLMVAMSLGAGAGFGLSMASYFRWKRKGLRLPPL